MASITDKLVSVAGAPGHYYSDWVRCFEGKPENCVPCVAYNGTVKSIAFISD